MYDELAKTAQTSANTFKNSLQYLIDAANQQKLQEQQSTSQRYTNLVNQINQQKEPLTTQYGQNAEAAYVNKMMSAQSVNENLSRLGLSTTGFGVGQKLQTETDYGQRLSELTGAYNQNLRNIDNQVINTRGEEAAALSALDSSYTGKLADINKYITETTQDYYKQTFANLLEARKYQDELKQQQWENDYAERQFTEQKRQASSSGSSGGGGFTSGGKTANAPVTGNQPTITNYKPVAVVSYYKKLGLNLPGLSDSDQVFSYTAADNTQRFVVFSKEDNAYVDITSRVNTLKGLTSAEVARRLAQANGNTNKSTINIQKPNTNKSTINLNKSTITVKKPTTSSAINTSAYAPWNKTNAINSSLYGIK